MDEEFAMSDVEKVTGEEGVAGDTELTKIYMNKEAIEDIKNWPEEQPLIESVTLEGGSKLWTPQDDEPAVDKKTTMERPDGWQDQDEEAMADALDTTDLVEQRRQEIKDALLSKDTHEVLEEDEAPSRNDNLTSATARKQPLRPGMVVGGEKNSSPDNLSYTDKEALSKKRGEFKIDIAKKSNTQSTTTSYDAAKNRRRRER